MLYTNEHKQMIKNNLEKILVYYGAIPSYGIKNWDCIPSRHQNPKNNLTVKGNICACHCGLKGDAFNVISEMEGIDLKEFPKLVKKGLEILNEDIKPTRSYYKNKSYNKSNRLERQQNLDINDTNLTSIINQNFKKAKKDQYEYFYNRGLTNLDIIRKHKIIVSNPRKIFPTKILPGVNNIWSYEYIIPIWKKGKVVNCILRRNDKKSSLNNKTMNLKGYNLEFLNSDYLQMNFKYLFICEGWSDALTFENLGYEAIAINSIVMINSLVQEIKRNLNNFVNTRFYIAFDQDRDQNGINWGQKAAKSLLKQLKEIGLLAFNLKIKEPYKDINEYFVGDSEAFKKSISSLIEKK